MNMIRNRYLPLWAPEDETGAVEEAAPAADPVAEPAPEGESDPADSSLIADGDKPEGEGEADAKPEAPAESEPILAEALVFPEGTEIDADAVAGFLDVMNNSEITPTEMAQKLVDLQVATAVEMAEASQKLWTDTVTKWQDEARALPEIGGEKLNETLVDIKAGLDKLGATDKTYEALTVTGAGNHPEIISILQKATAHLKEGQPPKAGGSPHSTGNLSQQDRRANALFPTHAKE